MKSRNKFAALALSVLIAVPLAVGCTQTAQKDTSAQPGTSHIVASPSLETDNTDMDTKEQGMEKEISAASSTEFGSSSAESKNAESVSGEYGETTGIHKAIGAQKKIEETVVSRYKAIEDGVVSGYKSIEDKFVDAFLSGETTSGDME